MEFDFSKLRGRIVEKYGTCNAFSAASGFSASGLSDRLNNKTPWDTREIHRIVQPDCLDIAAEDIPSYFFAPKVR